MFRRTLRRANDDVSMHAWGQVGALPDLEKAKNSRNIRRGKGKMRNRRYVMRKGPLVVYGTDSGISKAFRNLPGVDVCSVHSLNLLQLAPGGHLGRFVIWTKSAFEQLDTIFGEHPSLFAAYAAMLLTCTVQI